MAIEIQETKNGLVIEVRAHPSAGRGRIAGEHSGVLKIDLKSPPEDGKANKELIKILSKALGVPAGNVALISGEKSRRKRVVFKEVGRTALENFLKNASKQEK